MKEVGKIFLSILLLVFLSSGVLAVEYGTCSIVARTSCLAANGDNIVMGLSATTNAHGQTASTGTYPYVLCCNFANQTASTTCSGTNEVIGLSATTNAHAEIPAGTVYQYPICYSDFTCKEYTTCPSKTISVLSLSATTNAHIGTDTTYATKICCGGASVANSLCKIKSAVWSVTNSIEGQGVRLVVTGSSAADCNSVKVSFKVMEKDAGSYQDALINPVNVAFNGDTATSIWYSEYQDDGVLGGDPEYVFNASLTKNPKVFMVSTNELSVKEKGEFCSSITSCEDYNSEAECESDASLCQVSDFSSLPEVECDSESVTCGCLWNSEESSCEFGWGEIEDVGDPNIPRENGGGCNYGTTLCHNSSGDYCRIGSKCPTGEEPLSNNNGTCEWKEGCSSSDCVDADIDTCAEELYCLGDKCSSVENPIALELIGNCKITQTIEKGCEEEPVGYKIVTWTGVWTGEQVGTAYQTCIKGGKSTIPCAAQVQLPFFDSFELIATLVVLALLYSLLIYKKKHHKAKKRK